MLDTMAQNDEAAEYDSGDGDQERTSVKEEAEDGDDKREEAKEEKEHIGETSRTL
jgi:hypothetical protein